MSSRTNSAFPRPWLAGVCAWIAWQLDWNVSGVRIGALLMLLCMPFATAVAYLLAALCLGLQCQGRQDRQDRQDRQRGRTQQAPSSTPFGHRIDSIEERMRAFDEELERRRRH